jgi:hypothetical protein
MWKDRTRGRSISIKPKNSEREVVSSRLTIGHIRLTVHRDIHYEDDQWLMTCKPSIIADKYLLESKDLSDAKEEAAKHVTSWLYKHHRAVESVLRAMIK